MSTGSVVWLDQAIRRWRVHGSGARRRWEPLPSEFTQPEITEVLSTAAEGAA